MFDTPGFAALDGPVFRLTEGDKVPALALQLDGSEAVVTLRSIAKLFDIRPDSADGRMLHLITQSLQFVACLRLGDELPAEVLTGEASWEPSTYHRQIASARLQMQLVNWIGGGADGQQITSQMLVVSIDDPSIRTRVQEALRQAAEQLGLKGGGPAVAARIEQLADELAFIEALRERLMSRVDAMMRRLGRLACEAPSLASNRRETLMQVVRLAGIGAASIAARFAEVDERTLDILPALRDLEEQRSALRPARDWLYCTQIAWDPILQEWQRAPTGIENDRLWKVIDKLYRFLAPRYMAVQEWRSAMVAQVSKGGRVERTKAFVW